MSLLGPVLGVEVVVLGLEGVRACSSVVDGLTTGACVGVVGGGAGGADCCCASACSIRPQSPNMTAYPPPSKSNASPNFLNFLAGIAISLKARSRAAALRGWFHY